MCGFSNVVSYSLFRLNQENIVLNHCINKDKPQKKCHGKCYLKLKLKELNTRSHSENAVFNLHEFSQWFQNDYSLLSLKEFLSLHILISDYPNLILTNYLSGIDRPPGVWIANRF